MGSWSLQISRASNFLSSRHQKLFPSFDFFFSRMDNPTLRFRRRKLNKSFAAQIVPRRYLALAKPGARDFPGFRQIVVTTVWISSVLFLFNAGLGQGPWNALYTRAFVGETASSSDIARQYTGTGRKWSKYKNTKCASVVCSMSREIQSTHLN